MDRKAEHHAIVQRDIGGMFQISANFPIAQIDVGILDDPISQVGIPAIEMIGIAEGGDRGCIVGAQVDAENGDFRNRDPGEASNTNGAAVDWVFIEPVKLCANPNGGGQVADSGSAPGVKVQVGYMGTAFLIEVTRAKINATVGRSDGHTRIDTVIA